MEYFFVKVSLWCSVVIIGRSVCHSVALQVIFVILLICLSLHSLNFVNMSVTVHYSVILVQGYIFLHDFLFPSMIILLEILKFSLFHHNVPS